MTFLLCHLVQKIAPKSHTDWIDVVEVIPIIYFWRITSDFYSRVWFKNKFVQGGQTLMVKLGNHIERELKAAQASDWLSHRIARNLMWPTPCKSHRSSYTFIRSFACNSETIVERDWETSHSLFSISHRQRVPQATIKIFPICALIRNFQKHFADLPRVSLVHLT